MIKTFTLTEKEKWDEIVMSFPSYDVYYLSGYSKGFEINGDGEATLIYFEDAKTRAINVVMKREIKGTPYYDFATPYGYGGFLIDGENIDSLKLEYEQYCVNNNIVSEFVRFHPILMNHCLVEDIYEVVFMGNTVFMDISDKDTIWANITSKNRNVIRKAQKSGVTIEWHHDDSVVDTFIDIYNETMSRDNAKPYYFFKHDFYDSVLNDLKSNAIWACAKYEGKTIANAIFMYGNGQMHYHLSAAIKEYQHLAPTNLILYEAANWGNEHGLRTLHLGGGVGSDFDNLYKFKKAFNRQEDKEFYVGKKVFIQDVYDKLVDQRIENDSSFDKTTNFFPKYRG